MLKKSAIALVGSAALALALAGCSGGSAIGGLYVNAAQDYALLIEEGGKCGVNKDYDPETSPEVEIDDDCIWSLADDAFYIDGVTRYGNSLTGTLQEDGAILLPDQTEWSAEILFKQ